MSFRCHSLRRNILLVALLGIVALVLVAAFAEIDFYGKQAAEEPEVFVGVDLGYGDDSLVYNVSEAVAGHANLIILGSLDVTMNTTKLVAVCDYLYRKGFYFIIYVGFAKVGYLPPLGPDQTFFQTAKSRWGGKFLGAYMFDEVGGKQLDGMNSPYQPVPKANDVHDAAAHFFFGANPYLALYRDVYYSTPQLRLYTSDYCLYWFDYLCGYNVIFTEYVGNHSHQLASALVRGAATCQGKQWGAIMTFGSCENPNSCFENATEMYASMMLAWQNGAKYIVVFDSPGNFSIPQTQWGVLTQDHLDAIRRFGDYTQSHQQPQLRVETAYVLPSDYGFGFRSANDTIWGLWLADALSPKVWQDVNSLLNTYNMSFDVVYEDRTDSILTNLPYKTLFFWNGTIIGK